MRPIRRMICRVVGHDYVFRAEAGRGESKVHAMHMFGHEVPVNVVHVQVKEVCTRCLAARLVPMLLIGGRENRMED